MYVPAFRLALTPPLTDTLVFFDAMATKKRLSRTAAADLLKQLNAVFHGHESSGEALPSAVEAGSASCYALTAS